MYLLVPLLLMSLVSRIYVAQGYKNMPYGIQVPYPYGAKDPLESPEIPRILAMGDTMLNSGQQESFIQKLDMSGVSMGSKRRIFYWPKGIIPYHIDCSLKNMPRALAAIDAAIEEWQKTTCIKFVKRSAEKDYLVFLRDSGCWSSQGKINGPSLISVGLGCEFRNVISHLIGHVVGLWHPHNRIDRNDYIEVFWQNIDAVARSAFITVYDTDGSSGPYEYGSIMHFPWDALTNTGHRTMLALQRVNEKPYSKISPLDALQVSVLYNCKPPKFAKAQLRKTRFIPASRSFQRGCKDRNSRCPEWAASGFCERNRYIKENCKISCQVSCGKKKDENCKDAYQSCPIWAEAGYCSRRRLANSCKRSCGKCMKRMPKRRCKDRGKFCKFRARNGHCSIPWIKMICQQSCDPQCARRNSPLTVNKSKDLINCRDKYPFCKRWSRAGYCKTVKRVRKMCRGSCNEKCKVKPTTPRPTTVPTFKVEKTVFPVMTLRASSPTGSGRSWEFGKGVLCIDRNPFCKNLPQRQCESDTWMIENCAGTCSNKDCDNVLYRPADTCANPLGIAIGGKSKLPDSAFKASSYRKFAFWKASPENARLYLIDNSKRRSIGAWCAAGNGKGSWLEVDLGNAKTIRYIATQGRDKHFEKVREYKIAYSNDGRNFMEYKEGGKVKMFDGNCDHFTPVMNEFRSPIVARFIRIYPMKFNFACLRMELYGCEANVPVI